MRPEIIEILAHRNFTVGLRRQLIGWRQRAVDGIFQKDREIRCRMHRAAENLLAISKAFNGHALTEPLGGKADEAPAHVAAHRIGRIGLLLDKPNTTHDSLFHRRAARLGLVALDTHG